MREDTKTVSFPAQMVATERHVALLHTDITGKEGMSRAPRSSSP